MVLVFNVRSTACVRGDHKGLQEGCVGVEQKPSSSDPLVPFTRANGESFCLWEGGGTEGRWHS